MGVGFFGRPQVLGFNDKETSPENFGMQRKVLKRSVF